MRVLHVIAAFGAGGAERVVLMLARRQLDAGDAVALVAAPGFLDAELPDAVARFRITDRGRSARGVAVASLRLAAALREFRPDVVHTHGVRVLATALVARAQLGPRRGPPILATNHATAPEDLPRAARILRRADRVVCVSGALEARMRAAGVPTGRLSVVHNAVAPAAGPDPAHIRALAEELGVAGRQVVSLVGRLEAQKRPDRFVDVAAAVAAARPETRFLVVGDGSLRADAEARARRHALGEAIRFTGTRTDARDIIALSTLLVFTSTWEGLSIAAMEALAAGVPVVATDTDGMREILAGGAGVIVEDPATAPFAEQVVGLLSDDGRRGEIARRAAARLEQDFTPGRMVAAYREHYERLVAGRR